MTIEFITDDYVEKITKENPRPLNELGEFVYYRTYSRWLPEKNRREMWQETCKRAINYNMNLSKKHLEKINFPVNISSLRKEAQKLFKNMYETKQFLSGRTLWAGGANPVIEEKFVLGNFNCSYISITKWDDLADLFYLLMVGKR